MKTPHACTNRMSSFFCRHHSSPTITAMPPYGRNPWLVADSFPEEVARAHRSNPHAPGFRGHNLLAMLVGKAALAGRHKWGGSRSYAFSATHPVAGAGIAGEAMRGPCGLAGEPGLTSLSPVARCRCYRSIRRLPPSTLAYAMAVRKLLLSRRSTMLLANRRFASWALNFVAVAINCAIMWFPPLHLLVTFTLMKPHGSSFSQ